MPFLEISASVKEIPGNIFLAQLATELKIVFMKLFINNFVYMAASVSA